MLALKDTCVHPTSAKPYIVSFSGGRDHSPEGAQVGVHPSEDISILQHLTALQNGITHAFSVEFESTEDRDYYVKSDPVHQSFVAFVGALLEKAIVVDYTPGEF